MGGLTATVSRNRLTAAKPAQTPKGRLIQVERRAVNIRRTPASSPHAEPAVYVHGHAGSSRNWTDLAALLSRRLDGIAIDLPGFGWSEPPRDYGVSSTATTLAGAVAAVSDGPVHLIGNSFGGTLSLCLAAQRPELVRTLTLISPAMPFLNPRWSGRVSSETAKLVLGGADSLRRKLATTDPHKLVAESLAFCCADLASITPARVQDAVLEVKEALTKPWRAAAEASSFRALLWTLLRGCLPGRGSLRWLARQVKAPTLIVWGDCDPVLDVRLAARLAQLIPDTRTAILPGVGHLPHLEAPTRVASAITAFLEGEAA